jgi:hypothetical protein
MKNFYYTTDGTTSQGPINLSKLQEMRKANQLPDDVKVCEVGKKNWRTLHAELRQEYIGQALVYIVLVIAAIAVALKIL